jgi:cytohesin
MKIAKRIGLALVMVLVLLAWSGIARSGEIHDAAYAGDVTKVKTLLAGNPDPVNTKDDYGMTPLHDAVEKAGKEVVKMLLAHGADVNAKNFHDETPLHFAVGNGDKEVVKILVAHGADVNSNDDLGVTPLSWAVYKKHNDIAKFLRQHGGVE